MKHYICTGGCKGVSDTPGACKTEGCPLKGYALKECDCTDGKHDKILNMKKSPVVHFEMPYKDKERLSSFYSQVFGWDMQQSGPEMGNYVVAHTTETDEKQMVKTPGNINGGFFPYDEKTPGRNMPSFVIQVEDINKAMEDVEKAGGKIDGKPQPIPGIGMWVVFTDTEGNRVSILQS